MKNAKSTSLLGQARKFVADNIKSGFHDKRLARIEAHEKQNVPQCEMDVGAAFLRERRAPTGAWDALKLQDIIKRKNPYLFKAKAVASAPDMVRVLLEAHLSSQEETIFGDFLETLACFVCGKVYSGVKPATHGIDLDFTRAGQRYLVSVKSGPNWANSSQKKKNAR